jgi:hypothetical protein
MPKPSFQAKAHPFPLLTIVSEITLWAQAKTSQHYKAIVCILRPLAALSSVIRFIHDPEQPTQQVPNFSLEAFSVVISVCYAISVPLHQTTETLPPLGSYSHGAAPPVRCTRSWLALRTDPQPASPPHLKKKEFFRMLFFFSIPVSKKPPPDLAPSDPID